MEENDSRSHLWDGRYAVRTLLASTRFTFNQLAVAGVRGGFVIRG